MIFRLLLVLVSSFVAVQSDPISPAAKRLINELKLRPDGEEELDTVESRPVHLRPIQNTAVITVKGVKTTVKLKSVTAENLLNFCINMDKSTKEKLVLTLKDTIFKIQCSFSRNFIKGFGTFEIELKDADMKFDATGLDGNGKIVLSNPEIELREMKLRFVLETDKGRKKSFRNNIRRLAGTTFLEDKDFLKQLYDHVKPSVELGVSQSFNWQLDQFRKLHELGRKTV